MGRRDRNVGIDDPAVFPVEVRRTAETHLRAAARETVECIIARQTGATRNETKKRPPPRGRRSIHRAVDSYLGWGLEPLTGDMALAIVNRSRCVWPFSSRLIA